MDQRKLTFRVYSLTSRRDFKYVHLGLFMALLSLYLQCNVLRGAGLLPPGICLTQVAGDYCTNRSMGSSLSHSSPCATWNLFCNLTRWLSAVSSPHDPPVIARCLQGEGGCLGHHPPPVFAAQVKPPPIVHLGCSLPLGGTVYLSSPAHPPALNPYPTEPNVCYSDF